MYQCIIFHHALCHHIFFIMYQHKSYDIYILYKERWREVQHDYKD
jgi:hypothetical protein